jgi:hypothetical protein
MLSVKSLLRDQTISIKVKGNQCQSKLLITRSVVRLPKNTIPRYEEARPSRLIPYSPISRPLRLLRLLHSRPFPCSRASISPLASEFVQRVASVVCLFRPVASVPPCSTFHLPPPLAVYLPLSLYSESVAYVLLSLAVGITPPSRRTPAVPSFTFYLPVLCCACITGSDWVSKRIGRSSFILSRHL